MRIITQTLERLKKNTAREVLLYQIENSFFCSKKWRYATSWIRIQFKLTKHSKIFKVSWIQRGNRPNTVHLNAGHIPRRNRYLRTFLHIRSKPSNLRVQECFLMNPIFIIFTTVWLTIYFTQIICMRKITIIRVKNFALLLLFMLKRIKILQELLIILIGYSHQIKWNATK